MDNLLAALSENEREWLFAFMEANELTTEECFLTFLRYCLMVNMLNNKLEEGE